MSTMLEQTRPLQCLIDNKHNRATLVSGSDIMQVAIPDKYKSQVLDTYSSNPKKGIYILQTLFYVNRSLYEVSSRLFQLFGNDFEQINKVVGKLAADEKLEDLDENIVSQRANELAFALQERYGSAGHSRRIELMPQVFADPVITEVCAMHWQVFIRSQKARLLDENYRHSDKSYEYLFVYKGKRFLVANCGTGKVVILPVGKVNTCEQAQAWLSGDTVRGMPLPKFTSKGRT